MTDWFSQLKRNVTYVVLPLCILVQCLLLLTFQRLTAYNKWQVAANVNQRQVESGYNHKRAKCSAVHSLKMKYIQIEIWSWRQVSLKWFDMWVYVKRYKDRNCTLRNTFHFIGFVLMLKPVILKNRSDDVIGLPPPFLLRPPKQTSTSQRQD